MRYLRLLPLLLTAGIIFFFNHYWSATLPALGRILDPINGAMAAAERTDKSFNLDLRLKGLKAPVDIWLEDRLVPHIRAQNNHDLYLAQGYIHAYFRLWQMEFQTRAAAGRISESIGAKAIEYDRGQRRKGMVWGAEKSLTTMMADPRTREMLEAYSAGINTYIHSLNYRTLPIEYKLIGYAPEEWTPLQTSLLMKSMADDLSGKTDDIAYTIHRDKLGEQDFDFLFPEKIRGSKPAIPEGTKYAPPSLKQLPVPGDSVWAHFAEQHASHIIKNGLIAPTTPKVSDFIASGKPMRSKAGGFIGGGKPMWASAPCFEGDGAPTWAQASCFGGDGKKICYKACGRDTIGDIGTPLSSTLDGNDWQPALENSPAAGVGSNNWAISGTHTASGAPILCNDPHLSLTLPSLWFEMQLTAPGINSYGVSLPGAPGIVIGFNDSMSWGLTNNYRDVKDFYDITLAPPAPKGGLPEPSCYIFCGKSLPFDIKVERIKVKGQPEVLDTVRYTLHGPVLYDPTFPPPGLSTAQTPPLGGRGAGAYLACTWMGQRGSNELLAVYLLNRAKDYNSFTDAISHFECPAQNIAYADRAGNIAMWGQGRFINKWKGQGKFVMEGKDSATLWGQDIPMAENPHVLNPPQGYVASANQSTTDSTYPYWYNGMFFEWRSWRINDLLGLLGPRKAAINGQASFILDQDAATDSNAVIGMMQMQNDKKSILLRGFYYRFIQTINVDQADYFERLKTDNEASSFPFVLDTHSERSAFLELWAQLFYEEILGDQFFHANSIKTPSTELIFTGIDNGSIQYYITPGKKSGREALGKIAIDAFTNAKDSFQHLKAPGNAEWYQVKNTTVRHLARIPAFSYDHLKVGGWSNTINANTGDHGPSWRMIVEMGKDSIRAYGVYPGGQSGNPGSPYYANFLEQWVEGQYNALKFMSASLTKNPFKYTWTLHP